MGWRVVDIEVGAVGWLLGMVEVGLVVGCFWRRWLLWAAGGMGASGAIEGVGVLWAVRVGC